MMDRQVRTTHDSHHSTLVAMLALCGLILGAPKAWAENRLVIDTIVLSNADDGSEVTIPHVEFFDVNLERADIEKLLSRKVSLAEERELAGKLKAGLIAIPEIRVKSPAGTAVLHDLRAENVDSGKIGTIGLAGADITTRNAKGDVFIALQALRVDALDFAGLLHELKDPGLQNSVRFGHFDLSGMSASIVDPDTPSDAPGGNLVHIGLGGLTATNDYDGALFARGSSLLKNLTLEAPPASPLGRFLKEFGFARLDFDVASRAAYDPKAQSFTFEDISLTGVGMGRLAMGGRIGSLAASVFTGDQAEQLESWLGADLSDVVLRFQNDGLFDKLVNFVAGRSQRKPAEIKAEWRGFATQAMPQLMAGSSDAQKVAESLAKFIADPKNFTLTASGRAGPVPLRDLMTWRSPADFLGRVSLHASANE
jgi:hypothetical protein